MTLREIIGIPFRVFLFLVYLPLMYFVEPEEKLPSWPKIWKTILHGGIGEI